MLFLQTYQKTKILVRLKKILGIFKYKKILYVTLPSFFLAHLKLGFKKGPELRTELPTTIT